jgi:hypothetical protein
LLTSGEASKHTHTHTHNEISEAWNLKQSGILFMLAIKPIIYWIKHLFCKLDIQSDRYDIIITFNLCTPTSSV